MASYVIAVRRDARDRAPADWIERLAAVPGLTVEGAAHPERVQVKANRPALARARVLVGGFCRIEPVIPHRPR